DSHRQDGRGLRRSVPRPPRRGSGAVRAGRRRCRRGARHRDRLEPALRRAAASRARRPERRARRTARRGRRELVHRPGCVPRIRCVGFVRSAAAPARRSAARGGAAVIEHGKGGPMTLQRPIDIAVAASGLVLASPLLLLIAWLIRLDDGGPVLFTQTRVGADRKPFRIYKFRTMRDGVTTRIGRWLRQTGLDELPQLVNMLRGEMSLIGPRPLTGEDVERLGWDDDAHAVRWSVRPGIIGLAQLYAGRGKRLSWFLDVTYVRDRRLALDLGIFAAT